MSALSVLNETLPLKLQPIFNCLICLSNMLGVGVVFGVCINDLYVLVAAFLRFNLFLHNKGSVVCLLLRGRSPSS